MFIIVLFKNYYSVTLSLSVLRCVARLASPFINFSKRKTGKKKADYQGGQ